MKTLPFNPPKLSISITLIAAAALCLSALACEAPQVNGFGEISCLH